MDSSYAIPLGTQLPDADDRASWRSMIDQSSAPHIFRLAEEVVKARASGPFSFRLMYIAAIKTGTLNTVSLFTDAAGNGLVSQARILDSVSAMVGDMALVLVMPGGLMVVVGVLSPDVWVDWSGVFDLYFPTVANVGYTRGNATRRAQWRLDGDSVELDFEFYVGSTTFMPFDYVCVRIPMGVRTQQGGAFASRIPLGNIWVTDASTGQAAQGMAVSNPSDTTGVGAISWAYLWSPQTYFAAFPVNQNYAQQRSPATSSWPMTNGSNVHEWWTTTDNVVGHLRYRAAIS